MKNEKKEEMVITIERDDLFEIVNSLTWALSLLVASVILFVKRKIFLSLARGFFFYWIGKINFSYSIKELRLNGCTQILLCKIWRANNDADFEIL